MWLILFALQICDFCRSDRGLGVRVTCVQSRLDIMYYSCGGEHLSLSVHVIVCHIRWDFLGLCARRVWLILFALQICDICRSDRGLVLRVTCVQSRLDILYHRCRGKHLSLYVRTCDCLSYIYTVYLYSYNGSSSYMMYLQSVCILLVNRAVREAAGLSAQWPFTSVMLVMPFFLFLSARQ